MPTDGPPPTPPPASSATAAPVGWHELAPVALLQLDASLVLCWRNARAARLLGADAQPGTTLAALQVAPAVGSAWTPADGEGEFELPAGSARWVRASPQALPEGGWLVALQPVDDQRTMAADLAQTTELLDLARNFGRLGVWERDIRTLEGRWDAQVRRFWGVDPQAPAPHYDVSVQNIVEADRAQVQRVFAESLRTPGRYSLRYRVRGSDGEVRRLQSQWVVKAGADGRPERVLGLLMDDSEPFRLAQAVAEAESTLALAVELGGIAIWRHDLTTNRMHYSDQAWRVLGIPPRPEGLSLEEVRSFIHPDDLPGVLASAKAALASDRPTDMEARYRRSDGRWRHVMTRRVVQRDAAGQPVAFVGVGLDVTDRIAARRQAEELSGRFELVTRTAGIGYWSLEPGATRAHWSERMRELFGLARGEPAPTFGEWLRRFVHPDDRERVAAAFAEWDTSGRDALDLSLRIVRADGSERWILSHTRVERGGELPLYFGVTIDTTRQRSTEQALRKATERAALAARGAGIGTWEREIDSGLIHWDEQMWRLRGRPPREAPPTSEELLAIAHPDDRESASRRIQHGLASHEPVEQEFRVVWPDGSVHWLASRAATMFDDAGRPLRRIGVNWDITEVRSAESARRERELALRESQAKSKFLARMSHELRTPLNAVLGFAQLLLADEAGRDDAAASRRRRLEHIRSAGQHLLDLINDVLDLASLEGGEMRIALQPVALEPLVRQALPLLEPLRASRQVQLRCGPLPGVVAADATRLRQALLNLLSNALKYNRPGGEVRVESVVGGGQVVLRVADTGLGMDEQQLRQLFEPFNRLGADDSVEGTGIGLAIVKALVERMGGEVRVSSHVGAGSVFALHLPAADGQPAAAPAEPAADAAAPVRAGRQHQLLYIEDNPVNAMIIGELVARRDDLTLHVAADGASGVAQAALLKPELILLDMQLPDIDGFEVLRRLRADPATAGIPCIALSANAMPEDIQRALQAGMADYWTKPLDFKAFLGALDALFGKAPPS
ncbi:MAG: PAS domain-containing protein [Rubrivivax sp.]|nr:PAS domain-containing protein [Rubrivivax sp.]